MTRRRLPLDSPNWLILESAHRQLWEQPNWGDGGLAIRDLEDALANEKVRSMMRSHSTGERKIAGRTFWSKHVFLNSWNDGLKVVPRAQQNDPHAQPLRDRSFYAWGPDFKEFFHLDASRREPPPPPPPPPPPASEKVPRKRGPLPRFDWTVIGAEIGRRISENPVESANALVAPMLDWCEEKFGKAPTNNEMWTAISKVRDHLTA
jgi:hypothetical protein